MKKPEKNQTGNMGMLIISSAKYEKQQGRIVKLGQIIAPRGASSPL